MCEKNCNFNFISYFVFLAKMYKTRDKLKKEAIFDANPDNYPLKNRIST